MTKTVIHSVLVFDGLSIHPSPSMVTIDGRTGLIDSLEPMNEQPDASSSREHSIIIDGHGCTLIPGLIDAHVHVHDFHLPPGTDNSHVLEQPLRCGITTLCDMHCDPETILKLRGQVSDEMTRLRTGAAVGKDALVLQSDIKSCHYAATIQDGWPKAVIMASGGTEDAIRRMAEWPNTTSDNAAEFVRARKAENADYIKIMQEDGCCLVAEPGSIPPATPELQRAVTHAAHELGMTVVGHALSVDNTTIVLEAGADGLAHTICDQSLTDSLLGLYKKTRAFVIPTLSVISSACSEENDLRLRIADAAFNKGIIDSATRDVMRQTMPLAASTSKSEFAYDSVRQLKKAGIDILAGTDASTNMHGMALGPSLWMELEQYVTRCGMTPAEALTSATEAVARRLGFPDRGVIEPGRRADLLLVRGKPFENIQSIWEGDGIIKIWKNGILAL